MFLIGEFARIGQVSTAQLRRYDRMGLLTPQKVDNFTGYRYYSATQLPQLNRILALKELGLSLEQIGRALNDNVSAQELRGMLFMKKSQIEQMIHEEIARLRYIESRIDQIDTEGIMDEYDIVVKSVPAIKFLATRDIYESVQDARQSIGQLNQLLPSNISSKKLGYFTAILHSGGFFEGDIDLELGFQVEDNFDDSMIFDLPGGGQMNISHLPAVEHMVTVTRVGDPQIGHGSYGALARWMEANNFQISGLVREQFIQFEVGDMSKMVAEIQYPVQPMSDSPPQLT